jgi:hypothetical protein
MTDRLPEFLEQDAPGPWRHGGSGALRWSVFHVYDIDLFAQPDPRDPAADVVLDVTYRRRVASKHIVEASVKEMARLDPANAVRTAVWGEALGRLIPDCERGTRLTALFRRGRSLSLYVDGRRAGEIVNGALAEAFLRIWLDEATAEPALREQLLARI